MEASARVITQVVDLVGYDQCQETYQPEIVDDSFSKIEVHP
jgi:hypothetical protein